jgi:hypothetical protein
MSPPATIRVASFKFTIHCPFELQNWMSRSGGQVVTSTFSQVPFASSDIISSAIDCWQNSCPVGVDGNASLSVGESLVVMLIFVFESRFVFPVPKTIEASCEYGLSLGNAQTYLFCQWHPPLWEYPLRHLGNWPYQFCRAAISRIIRI